MINLKKESFQLFNELGSAQRTSHTPIDCRTYKRYAHLWDRLGEFIGKHFGKLVTFNTDEVVPSIIFRLGKDGELFSATIVDVITETEGINLKEANDKYENEREFGVIGYDTEFLPQEPTKEGESAKKDEPDKKKKKGKQDKKGQKGKPDKKDESDESKNGPIMLSHQFSFDFGPGKRFGVILDTDERFTDTNFLKFMIAVVSSYPDPLIKKWYVFAHFSLVEGSWVDSSKRKLIIRERKEWKGSVSVTRVIEKRENEEPGVKTRRKTGKKTGRKPKKKRTQKISVSFRFGDTMNLSPGSLKEAAKACGLEKLAVFPLKYNFLPNFNECCNRIYKIMDVYKVDHPQEFYRYGVRDAIIGGGIPIAIHSRFGKEADFQLRTAKYSEKHMSEWFKKNYESVHENWQVVIGQRKITWPSKKPGGRDGEKWEPDKLQQEILHDWYKGGRNEARQVGCFHHQVSYFDMTSAYPTSLAALAADFDFGTVTFRTRNDGAAERVKQLLSHGPFQPHGLRAYVRFKPDCKVPMAPISTVAGIIYPMETSGQVICWPEYWVAKNLDIIEEEFILELYEFRALETRKLPNYVLDMIKRRKEDKVLFKSILNYMSGKFAQGRDGKKPYSSITAPAIAAYITSTTRAAAAEIGNLNEYYAITTDGIISPEVKLKYAPTDRTLKYASINQQLSERLKPIEFEWMKNDFTGDKTVIWKTRGYILFNSQADLVKEPEKERFKQAKMGLQGETPADIIHQAKSGKGIRESAKSFASLDDGEVYSFLEKEFNVNPNFDFKYAIVPGTVREDTIEIDGVELTMPCFETRPLRNINEHRDLREISRWKALKNLKYLKTKALSEKDLNALILTATLNDRRCRHMVWEFRKRMVREIGEKDSSLHVNRYRKWLKKSLHKIPAIYGDIEDFEPIFEDEVKVIIDETKRPKILAAIIEKMKQDIETSTEPVEDTPEPEIREDDELDQDDDDDDETEQDELLFN